MGLDTRPGKKTGGAPKPVARITNPSSRRLEDVYRNIENEPLIDRIKRVERQLQDFLGIDSVEQELKNGERRNLGGGPKQDSPEWNAKYESFLDTLLDCFNNLLKSPYGSTGYLVKSNSESILKLYGVDSDDDYYLRMKGSVIRVSSKRLEGMIAAGGGRRFIGERGLILHNPSETTGNMRVADHVIHEIIYAIHEKLEELQG